MPIPIALGDLVDVCPELGVLPVLNCRKVRYKDEF
jgi:hypothetical protein